MLAILLLMGCKVDIIAPQGATIRSSSGAYVCTGPQTCTIDVSDVFFDETFVVDTSGNVTFTGWKRRQRGFCGGRQTPCELSTAIFEGEPLLLALLESDEVFFLEAEVASGAGVTVEPPITKDATIYADAPEGAKTSGPIIVGRNRVGSVRRALIAFDLSAIPAGATVTSVELNMTVGNFHRTGIAVEMHRLLADWGEGTTGSNSNGGLPDPAVPPDVTWIYRFFNTEAWSSEGGDFVTAPSATADANGTITWSGDGLRSDVQFWLENPDSNFGWILIGNETLSQSVQVIQSRESAASVAPKLVVTYTPAGQ